MELGLWQTDCPELALPFSRSRAQGSPEGGDHSLAGGARADVARPREPGRWPWSAGAKDPACPAGAPASPACLYPFLFQGPPAIFRLFLTQPSCLYRRWTEWGAAAASLPPLLQGSRLSGGLVILDTGGNYAPLVNADTWRGHTETRGSDTRTRTRAAHTRTRTDPRGRRLACTWVMFTGRRGEGPAGRDAQATLSHSRGTHATSPQPTQGSLRTLPAPGPHPQPLSALDVQRARPGRGLELS